MVKQQIDGLHDQVVFDDPEMLQWRIDRLGRLVDSAIEFVSAIPAMAYPNGVGPWLVEGDRINRTGWFEECEPIDYSDETVSINTACGQYCSVQGNIAEIAENPRKLCTYYDATVVAMNKPKGG
jgi:hypothetical protein